MGSFIDMGSIILFTVYNIILSISWDFNPKFIHGLLSMAVGYSDGLDVDFARFLSSGVLYSGVCLQIWCGGGKA